MSEDNGKLPTANDVNVLDWDEDGDSESPTPTTATDSKKASEPKQPKPEVKTPEPKAKRRSGFIPSANSSARRSGPSMSQKTARVGSSMKYRPRT